MNQKEAFRETLRICEDRWPSPMFGETSIEHMRDMLRRVDANSDAAAPNGFSEAKLGRWLGYLQGVAVALDILTLEDCKQINMRWADDAKSGPWRHKKRGTTYTTIGEAELQSAAPVAEGERLTIYRCTGDGRLWARPAAEFHDGRFERADDALEAK